MSEEKLEFKDRVSNNVNLRKLKVKNVVTNELGEITELEVVVERLDEPTEEGTALNEENMKKIIEDMINKMKDGGVQV